MNRSRIFILISAIFAIILTAVQFAGARSRWEDEAMRRKADYIFLRALGAEANDSIDLVIRMLERAEQLNPDDDEIVIRKGMIDLSIDRQIDLNRFYAALKNVFDANPDDYFTGEILAKMATVLERRDDELQTWKTLQERFPDKTDPSQELVKVYLRRYYLLNDTAAYHSAIELLEQLERGRGKELGLSSQKIMAYTLARDTMAALNEVDTLLRSYPKDINAAIFAGRLYNNLGMDSLAIMEMRRACSIDSTDGRGFVELANLYMSKGDSVAYANEVFQAIESLSLEFEAKYQLMRGYVSQLYGDSTQWERIEHMFSVLDRVNPGEAEMHALYGAFENERGNTEAAREQFEYAVALDPSNGSLHQTLVQLDFALKDNDAVIRDAMKAKDLFPDNFYYPVAAAQAYRETGSVDRAINILREVDLSDIRNPRAAAALLSSLADLYFLSGERDSAIAVCERVIALDSENFGIYNNLAYYLALEGRDLGRALRYAQFAILDSPDNGTFLDTYAWVLFVQGKYEEAKKGIDDALNAFGAYIEYDGPDGPIRVPFNAPTGEADSASDATILSIIEPVTADEPQPETDEELIEEIVEEDKIGPDASADIYDHAGDIYYMCGEHIIAVEFWKKALELAPDKELIKRKVRDKKYYEPEP